MARTTLKTVAEAAGVSISTVSNAYNRPDQMSDEVRERIFAVAKELGYPGPNPAARTLRSRRAGSIGLLFTEQLSYAFSDPYSVGMLAGLAEVVEAHRSSLLLIPLTHYDPANPSETTDAVETIRQAVIDGVVTYCVDADHPARQVARDRGLPMVSNIDMNDPSQGYVLIDEEAASMQIGRHLAALGHRRVGVIVDSVLPAGTSGLLPDGSPTVVEARDVRLVPDSRWRLDGVTQGLGEAADVIAVTVGHNSTEAGRAAAGHLLDRRDRPTAIVTISDVLALGALDALRQRGLVPGRDISVAGFDDIPAAEAAGLTTIRQPIAEKGRLLGRMLLDPEFTDRRVVLDTELVVRSSTGPAR